MGQWLRIKFVFYAIVTCATVGVVYAQVGMPLIEMLDVRDGPFAFVGGQIETVIPLILGLLLLASVVYLVVGNVQDERSRAEVRRLRR